MLVKIFKEEGTKELVGQKIQKDGKSLTPKRHKKQKEHIRRQIVRS